MVEVPLLRVGVTHGPQHFTGLVIIRIVKNQLWSIKGIIVMVLIHVAKARSISKSNGR